MDTPRFFNASEPSRTQVAKPTIHGPSAQPQLSDRQAMVLRVLVAAYVGQAGPVASTTLSHLIPKPLSPASIRNTLAALHEAGLIDKAHASAGRVPTPLGLQVFVDHLLELPDLGPHQQRLLDRALDGIDAAETPHQASHLLSEHTRQLGFVVSPRVERLRLQSLHLVPVSTDRVLAVLVAQNGGVIQRVIAIRHPLPPRELERVGQLLAERVVGRTLVGLRRHLEDERERLRGKADDLMRRVWALGLRACEGEPSADLVIATRIALLDQPEFSDPERIRGLFVALETNQRLLDLLRQIARADSGEARVGLAMSLGKELGEPSLCDCALVAVPYGAPAESGALGVLGVIGPQRMDYGRVIPLVSYCSELVTRKLLAGSPP
ncbi:MAG: heat-inducible transcription repressor HrcA [Deltaproteobacteria bacterium]|jgi:heat-inducible transcriptional repressor|nr:heat-inducible transcription repressor HrcA [Deltaproteobacteria bacterium]